MKVVLYTNTVSPHQMPLACELARMVGEINFRYIYIEKLRKERLNMGWCFEKIPVWCQYEQEMNDAQTWLNNADLLLSGNRALIFFEKRFSLGKMTFYMSERWFKPPVGILRLLSPVYFKMAFHIVKLLKTDSNFYYLPIGIHAARDMAWLCGIMSLFIPVHGVGFWKRLLITFASLFRSPRLDFKRIPCGRIVLKGTLMHEDSSDEFLWTPSFAAKRLTYVVEGEKNLNMKYDPFCLAKMRIWGYFVSPSEKAECELIALRQEQRQQIRLGECPIRILWVGRMLKWKRVDVLIKAVELALNEGLKVELTLVGNGSERKRLEKLASKMGKDTGMCILFIDSVPITQVRQLMREHDVYVLPSNGYEGWGAVVSEGLTEKMIVLGTYEAGSSATILDENVLFPSMDVEKLCLILKRTFDNEWNDNH